MISLDKRLIFVPMFGCAQCDIRRGLGNACLISNHCIPHNLKGDMCEGFYRQGLSGKVTFERRRT